MILKKYSIKKNLILLNTNFKIKLKKTENNK